MNKVVSIKMNIFFITALFGGIRAMENYDIMPYDRDADTMSITVPCITLPSAAILEEILGCYLKRRCVEKIELCDELAERRFTVFEVKRMVDSVKSSVFKKTGREFSGQKNIDKLKLLAAIIGASSNYSLERVFVSE